MNDHLDQLLRDSLRAEAANAPHTHVDVDALAARGAAHRHAKLARVAGSVACLGVVFAGASLAMRSGPDAADQIVAPAATSGTYAEATVERAAESVVAGAQPDDLAVMAAPAGPSNSADNPNPMFDAATPAVPPAVSEHTGPAACSTSIPGEQVFAFDGTVVAFEYDDHGTRRVVFDVHEWFTAPADNPAVVGGVDGVQLGDRMLVTADSTDGKLACAAVVAYDPMTVEVWRTLGG